MEFNPEINGFNWISIIWLDKTRLVAKINLVYHYYNSLVGVTQMSEQEKVKSATIALNKIIEATIRNAENVR